MNDWNNSPPAPWPAPLSAESLQAIWMRDAEMCGQDGDAWLQIVFADRDGAYRPIAAGLVLLAVAPPVLVLQAVDAKVRSWLSPLPAPQAGLGDWRDGLGLCSPPPVGALTQQPVPQAAPPPGFNLPSPLSDAVIASRKRRAAVRLRRKAVSPARSAAQSVSTEPAPVLIPQEVAMPQKRRAKRVRRGRAKRVPQWVKHLFIDYRAFRARRPDCLPKQNEFRHEFRKLFAAHAPKKFRPLPMPPPRKLQRGLSNAEASETRDKAMRERERAILKKERELRHSCNKLYKQGIKRDAARIKHPA